MPLANSRAAPGKIITYERLRENGGRWGQDRSPTTTHNNMPMRGLMEATAPGRLSKVERGLLERGSAGPTPGDAVGDVVSVVSSIRSTERDPLPHVGEARLGLAPFLTRQVFYANLGYNLLVEYAQAEVVKLDPGKVSAAQRASRLEDLQDQLAALDHLPVTQDALDLYVSTGVSKYEANRTAGTPGLKLGKSVAIPKEDRAAVITQVPALWRAWWAGR